MRRGSTKELEMTHRKRVALIGFMGSGKSTVGRILASEWSVPHIDTDTHVAARAGQQTVGDAFVALGEGAFRSVESTVLAEIVKTDEAVISTGGGIVEIAANQQLLAGWRTVFLYAELDAIMQRLSAPEHAARPLLQDAAGAAHRYNHRLPRYRAWATDEIDTSNLSPQEIVEQIRIITG
jgi:shikimate kinase